MLSFTRRLSAHGPCRQTFRSQMRPTTPSHVSQVIRTAASGAGTFAPGIVYTTTETESSAKTLAEVLVKSKLAACVQMKDVLSVYEWEGQVQTTKEVRGIHES